MIEWILILNLSVYDYDKHDYAWQGTLEISEPHFKSENECLDFAMKIETGASFSGGCWKSDVLAKYRKE